MGKTYLNCNSSFSCCRLLEPVSLCCLPTCRGTDTSSTAPCSLLFPFCHLIACTQRDGCISRTLHPTYCGYEQLCSVSAPPSCYLFRLSSSLSPAFRKRNRGASYHTVGSLLFFPLLPFYFPCSLASFLPIYPPNRPQLCRLH